MLRKYDGLLHFGHNVGLFAGFDSTTAPQLSHFHIIVVILLLKYEWVILL